jgi:hypothetical protein
MTEEIYPMPSFPHLLVRELTILDPDGYRLVFTAPINMGLGFDKMLERMTEGKE